MTDEKPLHPPWSAILSVVALAKMEALCEGGWRRRPWSAIVFQPRQGLVSTGTAADQWLIIEY